MEMSESILKLAVEPVDTTSSFRAQAYESLKRAITQMDIYGHRDEIRLDERQLSQVLGVSRTPIREAMSLLEQEGRSEEHTSELQSLMRISYAVFCLNKKKTMKA